MKTTATTKIEKVEKDQNPRLWRLIEHASMKRNVLLQRVLAFGLLAAMVLVPVGQTAQAQGKSNDDFLPPIVFRRQDQRLTRFKARWMRFVRLWAIPTTAITNRRSTEAVTARSTGTVGTPPTWPRRSAGTRSMAFWSLAARFSPRTAPRSSRRRPRD